MCSQQTIHHITNKDTVSNTHVYTIHFLEIVNMADVNIYMAHTQL